MFLYTLFPMIPFANHGRNFGCILSVNWNILTAFFNRTSVAYKSFMKI